MSLNICYNLIGDVITLSLFDRSQLAAQQPLKGGQNVGVSVQFHSNGTPALPPTGSALLLGVKKLGAFEGDYLCSTSTWAIPGSGTGPCTATLNTLTDAIKTALNNEGNPANDIAFVPCQAEIQYWPPGAALPTKGLTFPVQLLNWVNQGDEGETGAANPPFDARLTKLEGQVGQFSWMPGVSGLTGGGAGNLDGQTTAGLALPRLSLLLAPTFAAYSLQAAAPVAIASVATGNPSIIQTSAPHGIQNGWNVTLAGFTDGTPNPNGTYVATVIDATHFSIPENVTAAPTSSGTAAVATTSPSVILPADYNPSTNAVAWYKVA